MNLRDQMTSGMTTSVTKLELYTRQHFAGYRQKHK